MTRDEQPPMLMYIRATLQGYKQEPQAFRNQRRSEQGEGRVQHSPDGHAVSLNDPCFDLFPHRETHSVRERV